MQNRLIPIYDKLHLSQNSWIMQRIDAVYLSMSPGPAAGAGYEDGGRQCMIRSQKLCGT
jgi:hypothetical protein